MIACSSSAACDDWLHLIEKVSSAPCCMIMHRYAECDELTVMQLPLKSVVASGLDAQHDTGLRTSTEVSLMSTVSWLTGHICKQEIMIRSRHDRYY